jgi:Sulfotransferase family
MRHYAMFIGYPRSGHAVVAALLDAHPRMLFANGLDVASYISRGFTAVQVASLSIWNSLRFTRGGRRSNGYDYTVPNGSHGRWEALEVIGDKSGDLLSERLTQEPGLIVDLLSEFGGAARFIHVIRNPFDCIATIAARGKVGLLRATERFFSLCEANRIARDVVPAEAWHDLYLETLIEHPRPILASLCRFLGQIAGGSYLDACAKLLFSSPRRSRDGVTWPTDLVAEIAQRMQGFPWLREYAFTETGPIRQAPSEPVHVVVEPPAGRTGAPSRIHALDGRPVPGNSPGAANANAAIAANAGVP